MNIGLIIFAIIGSIIGLASTFYIVISMFWILGVKIVRRIKHGTPFKSSEAYPFFRYWGGVSKASR